MAKPRVYFDRTLDRWVADNGIETAVYDDWTSALFLVAVRWYGPAGQRWVARGGLKSLTTAASAESLSRPV
jgi:hypothetical protein